MPWQERSTPAGRQVPQGSAGSSYSRALLSTDCDGIRGELSPTPAGHERQARGGALRSADPLEPRTLARLVDQQDVDIVGPVVQRVLIHQDRELLLPAARQL